MDSGMLILLFGGISLLVLIILYGVLGWKSKIYRLIVILFVLGITAVWIYPTIQWYFILDEDTKDMVNIPISRDENLKIEGAKFQSIREYITEIRKSVNNMREILNNNDKLYRYPRIISPEQESKVPAKLDIRITNKFGVALDIDSYKFDIDRETFKTKILPGSRKKLSQEEIKKLTDEFFAEIERAKNLRNQLMRIEELKELKKKTITLGLDLAGGISFTLDVDEEALRNDLYQQYNARIDEELIRESEEMKNYISQLETEYIEEIKQNLRVEAKDEITQNIIDDEGFEVETEEFKQEFEKRLDERAQKILKSDEYQNRLEQKIQEKTEEMKKEGEQFIEEQIQFLKEQTKKDALEILRKRVDQFGVSEPEIGKTLGDRPLVQLPGADDPASARKMVTKAGKLEFRIVDSELMNKLHYSVLTSTTRETLIKPYSTAEELYQALERNNPDLGVEYLVEANRVRVPSESGNPEDASYAYKKAHTDKRGQTQLEGWMFLKNKVEMSGKHIVNPRVQMGNQQTGITDPYIIFDLDNEGTKIFAEVTERNKGKRLAIVLDNNVQSAPTIQDKIVGTGSISGNFTVESSQELVSILKAGSITSKLKIVSENVIGPKLGQENIRSGILATVIGLSLVMLFMLIWYKVSGLFADLALVLNLYLLVSILSVFHFTLTLPGIAGILLTIGMAVDANVLIFERIKEEMRNGKPILSAIDEGYSKAFMTIFDANLTTILAAIVLSQVGTGILKGFGVTLAVGIACSMFTALVISKLLIDVMVSITKGKKIWI